MEDVIKVEHLSKSYGNLKAVDDFSFSVKRGKVFGLLGANGAGKSTTIECVLGTQKADSGVVSILGMNPTIHRRELFEQVGVQFQETNYQENIKVGELCEVTASLYRNPEDCNKLLKRFGISDKANVLVKELSGGEKQRLFIVLALIPSPKVVFLDELTTGLDARARRDVWQILAKLKADGITILLTSHFMEEVETLCDEICILKKGKPVFYGTVSEAVNQSPHNKFEDAYLWFTDEEVVNNEIL
ncbi:ABC transporter ATP-binding protein [Acetivibrio mesophilus]|uniref:ABC transporter ATP-binding protein n=1 Tax=Acetivibrio mesophilus TaxID=2487273 RepID=A0A4Q0I8G7_9FIRM|nr:ABC transporter ATP-binding protein [Acetivibrio mesophilus]ODM26265.1 ABC transporter [Clostridium sp. Bc-iso-3]RXE60680.1 ABC transporter ATP-binding protein [Acetivibrio mesophilus]